MMDLINIDFIFFEKEGMYTKDLLIDVEEMKRKGLIHYIFCKKCIIFSSVEISMKEGLILEKIVNTDKGYNMLLQNSIKTDEAEYYLV